MDQQSQQEDDDRISQLPDDILHAIMSLLTLKEACITTALSERWRNLFPSIPRSPRWFPPEIDIDCWLESVRNILESRSAPVRVCTIRSAHLVERLEDFGNIIRILCNGGIQDLTIDNCCRQHYTVPSCLYMCRTPTRLWLSDCKLEVPSKFSGLGRLNDLGMEWCSVEDGHLQRLISGCSAIECLTLKRCDGFRNLVVDAPKLAFLDVRAPAPLAVSILNAPRLQFVLLRFHYYLSLYNETDIDDVHKSEGSRLVRLLESLGNIQHLFLEFLFDHQMLESLTTRAMPVSLQSLLPNLKRLNLKMHIDNIFMLSIVSCLLNSCPKLEDIVIVESSDRIYLGASVMCFWDHQMPSACLRNALSSVTVSLQYPYRLKDRLKLVNFLLENALVLKNLAIVLRGDSYHPVIDLPRLQDYRRELLLLQPASPDAVVELKTAKRNEY